jgi:hypothetical protein
MSCIPSIPSNLTPEQVREAKAQKLRYSSPQFSESKLRRLWKLTRSEDIKIRERAALDRNLTREMEEVLIQDEVERVRICLAQNKHITWETFRELAKDKDDVVRAHVALNMSCPEEVLAELRKDRSQFVRNLADMA